MPVSHAQDDCPARLKTSIQVISVPVPTAGAVSITLRLFTVLHRVVNQNQISAVSGDARANAYRPQTAALQCFPLLSRFAFGGNLQAAQSGNRANAPRKLVRQRLSISADDDARLRIGLEAIGAVADRRQVALAVTGRHEYHQPIDFTGGYFVQMLTNVGDIGPAPIVARRDGWQPGRKGLGFNRYCPSGLRRLNRFGYRFLEPGRR